MSNDARDSRPTGEVVMSELLGTVPPAADTGVTAIAVKSGRREVDWRALFTLRGEVSIFFWLFGMFLDERHKPSMSRIMLAFWTWVGYLCVRHELQLVVGSHLTTMGVPLANAVWTAWWAAEGVLTLAVFGPGVASYFAPGAAGAVAATAIGSAVRDAKDIMAQREKAKQLGEDGTEFDK
jgi:hypothetical protein